MIRGGNWNNGANAGVFYFNGNNSRANVNTNVGFRSALALFVIVCGLRLSRNSKAKGTRPKISARAACWRKSPEAAGKPRRLAVPSQAGEGCRDPMVWRP